MKKVLDKKMINANEISKKQEIARYYEYDERQSDYYGNAARYLEFLEKKNGSLVLSKLGRNFVANSRSERIRMLAVQMLSRKPFRESFELFLTRGGLDPYSLKEIIMKSAGVNEITAARRAQTVTRWISWLREYVH